jgi:hypothetical protein
MNESSVLDFNTKEEWNPDLEQVVKKEGEQSQSLFWLHNEASNWSSARNDCIQIPTIILASVTGFLSAASSLVPPIGIGAMSLFAGILNTVNSYHKYSQRAEAHKVTAKLYMKTYKNIETELALPIHQRENANSILKDLRHNMSRISEIAPPIPSNIIDKYNKIFKDSKVSAPVITNGIDVINICKTPDTDPVILDIKQEQQPVPVIINTTNSTQTTSWPSAVARSSPKSNSTRLTT